MYGQVLSTFRITHQRLASEEIVASVNRGFALKKTRCKMGFLAPAPTAAVHFFHDNRSLISFDAVKGASSLTNFDVVLLLERLWFLL